MRDKILCKTVTETYEKVLKVYGSNTLSRSQLLQWHTNFKKDRESVKDEAWSGRPIQVRTDANVSACARPCLSRPAINHSNGGCCPPPGQTVNQVQKPQCAQRLRKRVLRVRPEIAKTWVLHHDNAPCHTAFSVSQFLVFKGITTLPQPPYSPDMSLCNIFLFPHMKKIVKGQHFDSVEDIQELWQEYSERSHKKCSRIVTKTGKLAEISV